MTRDYGRDEFPQCHADDAVEGIGIVFFALALAVVAVITAIVLMF
jgi:hypothetical protein